MKETIDVENVSPGMAGYRIRDLADNLSVWTAPAEKAALQDCAKTLDALASQLIEGINKSATVATTAGRMQSFLNAAVQSNEIAAEIYKLCVERARMYAEWAAEEIAKGNFQEVDFQKLSHAGRWLKE